MTSTDHTPSTTRFERALGEELIALAAERAAGSTAPAPRRRRARRPLLAALAVGAAAVTAALVLPAALGGAHGGNAAYAVTEESDGTIAIRLFDPDGLDGMVAAVRAHGVKAAGFEVAHDTDTCPSASPLDSAEPLAMRLSGGPSVRFDPKDVPAGKTLLLVIEHGVGRGFTFLTWLVDEVPACVPRMIPDAPGFVPPPGSPQSGSPTDLPATPSTPSPPAASVTPAKPIALA
ncbi:MULTISPECIES: hypothetical protein [Kitasatospora]|uniref:Uncharacterized protein n=1 Tax=Kitasatospora setae (strain ATCC 33774 / DSM 43861 / JCM 3304 / KCC A-0304 / NBRC 14216 / KM-6054) TaxID=452652 RepID=E4NB05_KITSK|nr:MULTISPECIES: hypothetical protein [Kitasatospora]BAJ28386.1 hypothetical protein KSE_25730 [Kitasatospora setae KM-6054]